MSEKDNAGKKPVEQKPVTTKSKSPATASKPVANAGEAIKSTRPGTTTGTPGKPDQLQHGSVDSYQLGRRVWPD